MNYRKNKNTSFCKQLEEYLDVENVQNYIPLYTRFFQLNDSNWNSINLDHPPMKQLEEKELIIRACNIIEKKLNNFLEVITNKISEYKSDIIKDDYNLDNTPTDVSESDSETITDSAIRNSADIVLEQHRVKGIIKIENESHTFGNLLSNFLQNHDLTLFAGYNIDHLLIKELTIGYKTDGTDIIDIFNDIIKEAKDIFRLIKEGVEELK